MFKQYQVIELTRNLNSEIKAGMIGSILEVWSDNSFEVEFLDEEGINYEYNGEATFTVTAEEIKPSSKH
jgi:hypothetical protein